MSLIEYIKENKQDAVSWHIDQWLEAADTPHAKGVAAERAAKLLSLISSQVVRDEYITAICKKHKLKAKDLSGIVKEKREEELDKIDPLDGTNEEEFKWPEWMTKEEQEAAYKDGFIPRLDAGRQTGYYFMDYAGSKPKLVSATNFVLTPLYHVYSQNTTDNRRLLEVTNGMTKSIVEISSKQALSVEHVGGVLFSEGTYLPKGNFSKSHLLKIWDKIDPEFKMCYELNQLGWQSEGFFAFSNKVYHPPTKAGKDGQLSVYDDYGVAKLGDKYYLSPSNSIANAKVRASDNMYEDDMYLTYKESPIDFAEWCRLMCKAYNQNAWMAIPWVVATLFRDVILKTNQIPHLYFYGGVGSGKSAEADSIQHLFFSGKSAQGVLYKAYNLNQGTEFAYWNRMERFYNCPNVLNEFDENEIDEQRFRSIKSAYDGEGRTKGMKEKNRATTQKVVCTLLILGQYLGKKDDNAVLMRSLPIPFRRDDNRPEEQTDAFRKLEEYQDKGLSSIICELINLRPLFIVHYPEMFAAARRQLLAHMKTEGVLVPERILKNVSCMIAVFELLSKSKSMPINTDQFFKYALDFTRNMTALISTTSATSEFWRMIEYLADTGMIKEGIDYDISETDNVTLTNDLMKSEKRTFTPPKKLLFLKLNTAHTEYMKETKKITGKGGLNMATLSSYLKEQTYYIGWQKSHRFGNKTTSAFVFDYDLLDIHIETHSAAEAGGNTEELLGEVVGELKPLPGKLGFRFGMNVTKPVVKDGTTETYTFYYNCITLDPSAAGKIFKGYHIRLKGTVTEQGTPAKPVFRVDVAEYDCYPGYNEPAPTADEELPFGSET